MLMNSRKIVTPPAPEVSMVEPEVVRKMPLLRCFTRRAGAQSASRTRSASRATVRRYVTSPASRHSGSAFTTSSGRRRPVARSRPLRRLSGRLRGLARPKLSACRWVNALPRGQEFAQSYRLAHCHAVGDGSGASGAALKAERDVDERDVRRAVVSAVARYLPVRLEFSPPPVRRVLLRRRFPAASHRRATSPGLHR